MEDKDEEDWDSAANYNGISLSQPIKSIKVFIPYFNPINLTGNQDKWLLLPAFLRIKGLVKQHIDSFNYFVDVDLPTILRANNKITSDVDPRFWLKYLDIHVGKPDRGTGTEPGGSTGWEGGRGVTPHECRLRDTTYSAPIYVTISYTRGRQVVKRPNVCIGRLPIMLRSNKCVLVGRSDAQLARMTECPLDPGGYFIVKGTEKVILVQEQLSKNRIIVEVDSVKGVVLASCTSSTHTGLKTKTYVATKKGKIYLRHNSIHEDVPIVVALKAMGLQSDKEIILLTAGRTEEYRATFASSLEEASKLGVFTQRQALDYIGSRVKINRRSPFSPSAPAFGAKRPAWEEASEALATIVLAHVPVKLDGKTGDFDWKPKAIFLATMCRRVLCAVVDESMVDDRDYVGNKRLELSVSLHSFIRSSQLI